MNCDECQEQVFELIEREAVDPEGVREVLARCPECRATFEEMKAALQSVAALPVEAPPASVDAAVLRAAAERGARARTRSFLVPQWAAAAVALLAVGVGVWAIPTDAPEPSVDEAVAFEADDAAETQLAERSEVFDRDEARRAARYAEADELAGSAATEEQVLRLATRYTASVAEVRADPVPAGA